MPVPKVHFFVGDLRGGGAERAVVEIVNHINRKDFAITLIVIKKLGTYLHDLDPSIPVVELLDKQPLSGKVYILKRLISHLNATKPNVVLGFTTPVARFMLVAKRLCHIKAYYVVVEQNNVSLNIIQSYHRGIGRLMQLFTKVLYHSADQVVTVSCGIMQNIIRDYKIDSTKCLTIYNPVNIRKVRQLAGQPIEHKFADDDEILIVAIGRLVPQKGYEDMIEAIHLVNRDLSCKLLILGEGYLRPVLEKKIELLGLSDKIFMPGFVKNPWSYLSVATLFLSTSHWEGFSLAHIEAMACGVPLVLTDCNYGPKELIVSDKNGVLVPVGEVDKIAARVKELLLDSNQRQRIVSFAMQYVAKFDSLVIAQQYEKTIKKLSTA